MNGSTAIFSLDALGQPAAGPAGSASEGGENAFAEALTAALAASTQTAATPIRHEVAAQGVADEGNPAGSVGDVEIQAIDAILSIPGHRSPAMPKLGDDLDVGADIGLRNPSAASGHLQSALLDSPAKVGFAGNVVSPVTAAATETASLGVDGSGAEPATMAKANPSAEPNQKPRHQVPGSELAGAQALANRSGDNIKLDPSGVVAGAQLKSGTLATLQDRLPLTASVRREPAMIDPQIEETSATATPASGAARRGNGSAKAVSARAPMAELASQAGRPAASASSSTPTDPASPAPAVGYAAGPSVLTDQASLARERFDATQRFIDAPADRAGTIVNEGASRLVASQPGNGRPISRPAAGSLQPETSTPNPLVGDQAKKIDGLVEPDRRTVRNATDGRPNKPSIAAVETGGNPLSSALANSGGQQAVDDLTFRPNAGFNGFDRLQPVLSAEGAAQEVGRFEPAPALSAARSQATSTSQTAGAQIALQIVRSVPGGMDRFHVHLHPVELGSVDIQLNFESAGRLSALITAERPETLELLQRDSRLLERSLGDSGLKLANDGLSFALKQDQQQQQQGQNFHQQAQDRQAAFQAGRAYDSVSDTEPTPTTERVEARRLLDIET